MKAFRSPVQNVVACRQRRGVTLMEVVVSMFLVSVVLVASLAASANLWQSRSQQRDALLAARWCGRMLDEVTAMDFRDRQDPVFGRESDETGALRTTFDDVDDYHGYGPASLVERDGTPVVGGGGWTVQVTVEPAEPSGDGFVVSLDEGAMLRWVRVVYTSPGGQVVEDSAIVSGLPNDTDVSDSYQRWRSVRVAFPDGQQIVTSAPLRNHVKVVSNP